MTLHRATTAILERKILSRTLLLILVISIVIIDRVAWASVAQWREDQATNIWLGYTQDLLHIPVGLFSSYQIPNPNGMLILGYFLSRLPDLMYVGTVLGLIQAALILWLCQVSFGYKRKLFWIASIPLLTSVILRASSVEFWSQWILIDVNLLFLLWVILYIRKPTYWKIPLLIALAWFAAAIYLAGIVNAIVMGVLGMGIIFFKPPEDWRTNRWKTYTLSIIIISISIWLTWAPYFKSVDLTYFTGLLSSEPSTFIQRVLLSGVSLLLFPAYGIFQWAGTPSFVVLQSSTQILSKSTIILVLFILLIHFAQALLAFFIIYFVSKRWLKRRNNFDFLDGVDKNLSLLVVISGAFIVLSYSISPLLGGSMWALNNERPDQVIQLFPFFLLFWFLTPFMFQLPETLKRSASYLTYILVALYAIINIAVGFMMIESHLSYRGNTLTHADVPLLQKMAVVDFIAQDWKTRSNMNQIPVDYQLGGGIWDWVTEAGQHTEKWYPAPFTMGRHFDYDLQRRYGLTNSQEGVQLRSFGKGRYLINYAFDPAPNPEGVTLRHYKFGRLRVTVAE